MITGGVRCTGCGLCEYTCLESAIRMEKNEKGFLTPCVDIAKCVSCGLCDRVCQQDRDAELNSYFEAYAGRVNKDTTLMESQSGGAFWAIADNVLKKGGAVYGAEMSDRQYVRHIRVTCREELIKLQKSKYVQSDMRSVFSSLKDDLTSGRTVLFSGTPCQCSAVELQFPRRKNENLILCDLICHGVSSPGVWENFLWFISKGKREQIGEVFMRDKRKHGWKSYISSIKVAGKEIQSRIFTTLFDDNYIIRESCFKCKYARTERVGDITIGDAWGIEKIKTRFPTDDRGLSLVLVNTQKGKEIFDSLPDFIFEKQNTDTLILSQRNLHSPSSKPEKYDQFWNDYRKQSFKKIAKTYGGNAAITRIKYWVKYTLLK